MAKAGKQILFLCTGNYYRSRFAEIVFNSVASKLNLPWQATSRGLAIERGIHNYGSISKEAAAVLGRMAIHDPDALARVPARLTVEELQLADRVIALKYDEHRPLLQERYAGWEDRVEYWHIDDVPGILPAIEQEIMALVARLLGGGNRPIPEAVPVEPKPEKPAKPLTAKVGRETAGRRGKGVTTVFDLPLDESALQELAATLKTRCGTGGTVKDGRIEIQGDQRERIIAELEKLGYKVKRVGG